MMELRRIISQFVRNHPRLWRTLNPINRALRRRAQIWQMEHHYGPGFEKNPAVSHELIRSLLRDGQPHGIAKVGSLEAEAMGSYLRRGGRTGEWSSILRQQLLDNVGIFPPSNECLDRFCADYLAALRDIDLLGVLGGPGEADLLRQPGAPRRLMRLRALEPWFFANPWSAELAGRRVVVVHPFATTIEAQYRRRTEIWRNPDVLPEFALRTVRMPLSAGLVPSSFADWRQQFDALVAEIDAAPYDVLITGAGGVSLLFVAHARRTGHVGIHLGGNTQILFGIRGRRFDRHDELQSYCNDAWTRPSAEETPPTIHKVEQGCYW